MIRKMWLMIDKLRGTICAREKRMMCTKYYSVKQIKKVKISRF